MSESPNGSLKDLSEENREEMLERAFKRRQAEVERGQPMNPDRDFSWEKTSFEGYDND